MREFVRHPWLRLGMRQEHILLCLWATWCAALKHVVDLRASQSQRDSTWLCAGSYVSDR
jgi:hypothetical protein